MKDIWYGTSGPRDAKIVLVGEAWGREEAAQQKPFMGSSGKELDRMLLEAGIRREDCFATNVIAERPQNNEMWRFFSPAKGASSPPLRHLHPEENVRAGLHSLYSQLRAIRPKLVIAVGNYSLWALTNCTNYSTPQDAEGRRCPSGIESWRGSMWYCDAAPADIAELKLLPIIHPAGIMREWSKRACTVHDLRTRVPQAFNEDWRPVPSPVTLAPPSFREAKAYLEKWLYRASVNPFRLVNDIETSRGLMTCIGFADSESFAMTIPFIQPLDNGKRFVSYWSEEEEHELVRLMRKILLHPNIQIEGQNYLYDTQYVFRFLEVCPMADFDTMLAHHLLFPGTPKGLDYLSSLYCKYHWYWKEDGKDWDLKDDPKKLWEYNALDCLRQYECGTVLRGIIRSMGQTRQWQETLERNRLALRMMLRGVRIDKERRARLALELATTAGHFAEWFNSIFPQSQVKEAMNGSKTKAAWFDSPIQQRILFGDILGLSLPKHRKTGNPTMGKEGISHLRFKHPEFARLFDALRDYRSVEVFHNTFLGAPLDPDGRMRCMFNVAGTETFRWSSSENAFGRGTNLQNIPSGNED